MNIRPFLRLAAFVALLTSPGLAFAANFNPDPVDPCECITITVDGSPNPTGANATPTAIAVENGNFTFNLDVKVSGGDPCASVKITKVELRSKAESGKLYVPTVIQLYPPTGTTASTKHFQMPVPPALTPRATISGFLAQMSNSNNWEVFVTCSGARDGSPIPDSTTKQEYCTYPLKLGGCTACQSCSSGSGSGSGAGPPQCSNQNGGMHMDIRMGPSEAGDTTASVRFDTTNLTTNPGRAGITASVPSTYLITPDESGISAIISPTAAIEVSTLSNGSFNIQHKHVSGGAAVGSAYRTTTIALDTNVYTVTSTFDGATFRYRQSQPAAGTLLFESGPVVDGTFTALRKEALIITIPQPGTEIHRETVEERASGSTTFATVSDIKSTWNNYAWGWEMTEQVIDPDSANLVSSWIYYQPGETTGPSSTQGVGSLKSHTRYDGYQEVHTYWFNNHQVLLPFAGTALGLTVSDVWDPGTNTHTATGTVGTTVVSKNSTTYNQTANTITTTTYSAAATSLSSTTTLMPFGSDFGGQPASISHPDGTLTTNDYQYQREGNLGTGRILGKTVTTKSGSASGGAVGTGRSTLTTYNRNGTAIRSVTETIGYTTNITVDHSAVTSVDDFGRALTTAFFPTSSTAADGVVQATISGTPAWTTATSYSCCGVATSTDRQGVVTTYGYDGLRRQTTSTARGVTTETVRNGLTTDTYRYVAGGSAATGNRISSNSRNLAGTTTSSSSPDPSTPGTAGALVATTTATSYKPAAGLGSRTVTTVPGGFTQTTDSYLDGRIASTTGDLEPTMTHVYTTNGTGFVTTTAYASGYESTATNTDWAGRTFTITQAGASTTHIYNSLGQLYSVTDADDVCVLSAFNSLGERTVSALDINGNSLIDYKGTDQITVTATEPGTYGGYSVMTTTSGIYTTNGNDAAIATVSTSHQTPDGLHAWSIALGVANPARTDIDSSTWASTTTNPDGTSSVTTLNADGLTDTVKHYSADTTPVLIAETDYTYDTLKRPSTTVDSRTGTTTTAYVSTTCDAVLTVTDPGSRVTTFAYDSRGRRVSTTLPEITLPGTNVTYASYYPDGQVKASWGSQTYPTYTTYDYAGRRKTLHTQPTIVSDIPTDAGGSLTTWNYSTSTGTLTSKLDNAGKGPLYAYTDAKRLYTRTWESGTVTTYGYTAGQLTGTNYSDNTPDVTITFKRFGRPDTVTQNLQSKIQYTYNSDLSIDTEIVSYDINHDGDFTDAGIDLIRTLDRSTDSLGRNTGWQLKDGGTLEHRADYTYDTAGRLSTVAEAANTYTYGYQYNQATASDPRVGSTSGSQQDFMPYSVTKSGSPALQTLRTYEAKRNALAIIGNKADTTVRSSYTYTVNGIGQRTDLTTAFILGGSLASNPGDTDWAYDSLGQVQSAAAPGSAADRYFTYDSIGNRLQSRTGTATNSGGTLTEYFGALTPSPVAGANLLNQYVGIATGGTTIQPLFDDDGNATSYPLPAYPAANSGLAWDGENRQVSVTVNGVLTTYLYDAISRRIAKVPATGSPTLYIYDGWNCIAEYTGTTLSKSRTWGLDLSGTLQGAGGVGGLLAVKQSGSYFYPTYDGNGNVSEYLAADGSTAAHFEYDPFGNTVVNTDTGKLFNYRFSTKPLDFETGLYYYGYRYYDPATGRWPSRDPIEEDGGVNLYGFCKNRGNNGYDLLGLWTEPKRQKERWAETCAQKDDTWESLAKMLDLKADEASKWVKNYSGGTPEAGTIYKIPNTIPVYSSNSTKWVFDSIISIAHYYRSQAKSYANQQESEGYKVIRKFESSNATTFIELWQEEGIYKIYFAGHGSETGGYAASQNPDVFINANDVSPPYRLSTIYAMHCFSLDKQNSGSTNPDGSSIMVQWRDHAKMTWGFHGYGTWLTLPSLVIVSP